MKKSIAIILLLIASALFADVIVWDKSKKKPFPVNINELDIKYCKIVISGGFFSGEEAPYIDYGKSKGEIVIRNSRGNYVIKKFNSDIEILNYMFKNGWVWKSSDSNSLATSFYLTHLLEKVTK